MNSQLPYFKSIVALVAVACLFGAGCNKGPVLIQVKGTAKVDGNGVKGMTLLFHPDDASNKFISSATSGDGGSFSVVTDTNPGIPAGKYTVTATYPDPSHKPSDTQIMMGTAEPGKDLLNGRYVAKAKGLKVEIASTSLDLAPLEFTSK